MSIKAQTWTEYCLEQQADDDAIDAAYAAEEEAYHQRRVFNLLNEAVGYRRVLNVAAALMLEQEAQHIINQYL